MVCEPCSAMSGMAVRNFLLLGGDLRNGLLRVVVTPPGGPAIATNRLLQMQADVRGQVALGPVRVHGSLGFAHEEAELTQVTAQLENNLVAREYWVGYDANEEFLVRLGRFTLPFGLRSNEHTMWVRQAVQDTTRDGQQTGLAAAYNHESLRTEVMAFIGNFGPFSTIYTTQGASGYAELTLGEHAAVGISALVSHTTSAQAIDSMRQAYGAFGRWSPVYPLVLMAEFDALLNKIGQNDGAAGYVGLLQADVQIIQGVHVLVAGEIQGPPGAADGAPQLSGWGGVGWFCLPHTDVRIDGTLQRLPSPNGAVSAASLLGQLHIYL